jgi:outer membrane protein assembly factor BamB
MGSAAEGNPTIAADGTIYAGSAGTAFYALSGGGQTNWSYDVGSSLRSGAVPSYDGKVLFFVAENRDQTTLGRWGLYALNRTGTLRWVFAPPEKDLFPNAVAMSPNGRTLYCPGFGQSQAAIYALDTSGTLRWRYVAQGSGTHVEISSPCVDNDGNIYFATGEYLYSLTPSGILRWQAYAVSQLGSPAIGREGSIYLAGQHSIMAFDNSGRLEWQYPIQMSQSSPAIDIDGVIYVGTATYRGSADTTNFLAINPNGSLKFRLCLRAADSRAVDIDTSPAIGADGGIYIGSDRPQGYRVFKIR